MSLDIVLVLHLRFIDWNLDLLDEIFQLLLFTQLLKSVWLTDNEVFREQLLILKLLLTKVQLSLNNQLSSGLIRLGDNVLHYITVRIWNDGNYEVHENDVHYEDSYNPNDPCNVEQVRRWLLFENISVKLSLRKHECINEVVGGADWLGIHTRETWK